MGVEKCLYSNGRFLRFSKYNELPVIRAKQDIRGIVIKNEDDKLQFKFNGNTFGVAIKDGFEKDEVNSILEFMYEKDRIEREAIATLEKSNTCISTYRACFASLVCKTIRNKLRVYVHITLEGDAKPKYDKLGNLKHTLGKGKVGCDIGTQSIAYTTDTKLALKNLAQRDLYSSFLLYNIDLKARTIDRAKCIESFNDFLVKQQDLITYIKVNKIKVANSGIKL